MSTNRAGFTFIEVLIVMLILSIGLFTIIPKVAPRYLERLSSTEETLNGLISEALKSAREYRKAINITFIMESGTINLEGKVTKLPDDLTIDEAAVNEEPAYGPSFNIKVYPVGISDYFELKLSDGSKLVSLPLFTRVELINPK